MCRSRVRQILQFRLTPYAEVTSKRTNGGYLPDRPRSTLSSENWTAWSESQRDELPVSQQDLLGAEVAGLPEDRAINLGQVRTSCHCHRAFQLGPENIDYIAHPIRARDTKSIDIRTAD